VQAVRSRAGWHAQNEVMGVVLRDGLLTTPFASGSGTCHPDQGAQGRASRTNPCQAGEEFGIRSVARSAATLATAALDINIGVANATHTFGFLAMSPQQ